jgi:hypothetical protein
MASFRLSALSCSRGGLRDLWRIALVSQSDFHRVDKGLTLKSTGGSGAQLAKPLIQPIFVLPSSLIAIAPFRHLWNNPPSFVGENVWLAFFTPVIVFFVIALALSYLMTVCWRLWKSD